MNFTLVELTERDYTLIQNLIRFYVYDMSEFMGWPCPENGLFGGVDDQPYYFGRTPDNPDALWPDGWTGLGYKIMVAGEIAGFCLVRLFNKDGVQLNDIGEFFILRKFRRHGLGQRVAHTIFDRFPGNWQVRQLLENQLAQQFWRKVIDGYTNGRFQDRTEPIPDYGEMQVQTFVTPATL